MCITVAGTALSVAFIMLYTMMDQVYTAPFVPESNRDRTLHVNWARYSDNSSWKSWALGDRSIRECIYPLTSAEAVGAYSVYHLKQVSLPAKSGEEVKLRGTDAGFWKVFNFTFIHGKPYTKEAQASAIRVAVIDEDLALKLWGTSDVAGRTFLINYVFYQICGVVRPVSSLATYTYAQVWVPYSTMGLDEWKDCKGTTGTLKAAILAHDKRDFPKIRKEFKELVSRFNKNVLSASGAEVSFEGQPEDQRTAIAHKGSHLPDMDQARRYRWMVYALLLLIPAVNLSTMLNSRLRQRRMEIRIRRSFGASRQSLMRELFTESFLVTVLGGIVGMCLCLAISYIYGEWLFYLGKGIDLYTLCFVLFRWYNFAWLLLICFALNFISSVVPVWRTIRLSIVATRK